VIKLDVLNAPTPVLWVGLFLTFNGVLAVLNAITWSLLWLVGFESVWTTTVMLTASLLFIEFHFARRIIRDLEHGRRMLKMMDKIIGKAADAGKEDA
jgi:hypothetical protein